MRCRAVRWALAASMIFGVSSSLGCATSFVGDARFPGGALGCYQQCQKIGMEMATFVYVGEYSTACACKPKVAGASSHRTRDSDIEAAVAAAGAGVELQRRRLEEERAMAAASTPK